MASAMDTETHREVRTGRSGWTYVKWALGLIVLAALSMEGWRFWQQLQRVESTDDAQIDGTIAPVSARIGGNVTAVTVVDDQMVKAGDVLVQLDRKDYEVALAKAQADLADAEAGLESARSDIPVASVSSSSTLSGARSSREDAAAAVSFAEEQLGAARSRLSVAQANVRVAQANKNKTSQDVERYRSLAAKEEIARQTFDQAVAADQAGRRDG